MPSFIDLTGHRYGHLTVLSRAENVGRFSAWECVCDCGNKTVVQSHHLRNGHTKSCGCYRKSGDSRRTHGMTNTRLHRIWAAMKARCCNENIPAYKYYGGRGITICDEWKDSFEKFYAWAVKSGYRDNLSIDRIDNNKGYSPENCRWATNKEQSNNQRSTRLLTYDGETHSLAEWADITGINYRTLIYRVNNNWDTGEALYGSRYQYHHERKRTPIG